MHAFHRGFRRTRLTLLGVFVVAGLAGLGRANTIVQTVTLTAGAIDIGPTTVHYGDDWNTIAPFSVPGETLQLVTFEPIVRASVTATDHNPWGIPLVLDPWVTTSTFFTVSNPALSHTIDTFPIDDMKSGVEVPFPPGASYSFTGTFYLTTILSWSSPDDLALFTTSAPQIRWSNSAMGTSASGEISASASAELKLTYHYNLPDSDPALLTLIAIAGVLGAAALRPAPRPR